MKKITIFLLSLFTAFSLMAQLQMEGPSGNYEASRGVNATALYSQMTPSASYGAIASQEFPDFADCRLQSADDFIVPSTGYGITRVEALGVYFNGPGPATTFIVEIYADNAGLPGTLLHSQTGLAYTEVAGLFSIPLTSTIQLTAGHYWISIMSDQNFSVYGQWGWQWQEAPQINYEFANEDPCNLLSGSWSLTWGSGSSHWPGRPNYDLCFALYGATLIPLPNWPIILGILLISAFLVFRYRSRRLA